MSVMVHPSLAALLAAHQQGGPPEAPEMGPAEEEPTNPLQAVQDVITDTHRLMVTLHDPAEVDAVAAALRILTQLQRRMMGQAGGPGPSAG